MGRYRIKSSFTADFEKERKSTILIFSYGRTSCRVATRYCNNRWML